MLRARDAVRGVLDNPSAFNHKYPMTETKKIYKPRPVTGFPEWLPDVRMVEQQWFDHIRRVFESYGFCSIETPSVEELDVLRAKGEVDKEIYCLERLHKDESDSKDARLALHFDQTVPLARYVAQHFNDLVFPFKRYQMQRVWRGERPQAGRFREFYQCDIDVINVDNLPLHFDAELPAIMWEILSALPGMEGEKIQIRVSNKKILMGLIDGHLNDEGDQINFFRLIDKIHKEGLELLLCFLSEKNINIYLINFLKSVFSKKSYAFSELDSLIVGTGIAYSDSYKAGINELKFILQSTAHLPLGSVVADLSIVRGLDYYTGTVYETVFTENPGYGSICSGGRYDDLASGYINKNLPGVGMSIGFSRLFSYLKEKGKLPVGRQSAADILVVLPSKDRQEQAAETARTLRARGMNVEMYHRDAKIKNQMAYAEKKGIPYVWFPPFEAGQAHEVKDMKTGTQSAADPSVWTIPGT